ncbi:Alcohol dehydrogenase cytochrome c subunit precursor [Luteitalea pratensis]|uniref:Alcohol dehydrogenase cytochrome c subunit n=1 Tax=Luteitalea pratensis TaxID=1855912 RepID=A0A143PLD1_LUTPR|nr:c-type cytochrome [Luteitalea pratensis]AMY08579.1 Alcohol dehydrogenase cytochrome c subunit precursor [Luteitalea pratensis]
MPILLKWITRTVITLLVLVVLLVAAVFASSMVIRRRTWDVPATAIAVVPTDAAAIAEGGRLARILGCTDCHGEHLEGRLFFSEPHVADMVAPNLSRLVPSYSDAELARAIRHGIRRDGTGIFAMPSASFFHLSDEDLGRLIAYLRRQPRRDGDERVTSIGPIGHVGVATGRFQTVAATMDHGATRMVQAPLAKTAARGEYLARIACSECHGLTFGGGLDGKAPPLLIAAAYPDDAFRQLMRTGETLGKRDLYLMDDVARHRFSHFSDDEVTALHTYFRTLTAR